MLEKTLESPMNCKENNQSILKEINPEYSLEGLMLKFNTLATWCEEPTHVKKAWCWERLKAKRKGDSRGWDGWMASLTRWAWIWSNCGREQSCPGMLRSRGYSQTQLSNTTTTKDALRSPGPSLHLSRIMPSTLHVPFHSYSFGYLCTPCSLEDVPLPLTLPASTQYSIPPFFMFIVMCSHIYLPVSNLWTHWW